MTAETETTAAKVLRRFPKDVEKHEITIVVDDGVHRHVALRQPVTGTYAFTLTTWPGHLCISGDMGCFVFARLDDMFEFFRHDRINPSYWAEKLQAHNRSNGHREFSEDLFREAILSDFERWRFDSDEQRTAAREALDDEFGGPLGQYFETADAAIREAIDYRCPETEQRFEDFWEYRLDDYTFHFLWCLHAIRWGVERYDVAKAASAAGELEASA